MIGSSSWLVIHRKPFCCIKCSRAPGRSPLLLLPRALALRSISDGAIVGVVWGRYHKSPTYDGSFLSRSRWLNSRYLLRDATRFDCCA
ncbi:hypothetical protein K431DRAFT_35097 [Polychaeton citri CBS 116435]|uniref:Uncharacterized protein n=1 Tax=Polychaeton citri CBS 116435 TaxID=1314669 RepID=A0A9P4Q096_9PEZI|nr:hypothetical protein K431DRAFT_35097 [Polychaeton citri CBS 116435]